MDKTDTLADLHDAIDRIGLLRIERHLDCADPRAESDARASLATAIAAHVAAEVARALAAAPGVEEAIIEAVEAACRVTSAEHASPVNRNDAEIADAKRDYSEQDKILRAAIAADRARAVAEARPTPDEARRLAGDLVRALTGGVVRFPPSYGKTMAAKAIDDASAALLRALGVEA